MGTPSINVARWSLIAARTAFSSKRGTMINAEPASMAPLRTQDPYTCARGNELTTRSSGPRAPIRTVPAAAATTERWLCIAPLGWPVVPEV